MTKKIDQGLLYQTQISLSEWFEGIGHQKSAELRLEDNEKRERLKKLNELMGLPFDKPTKFLATDISEQTEILKDFLKSHSSELCALRLIPIDPKLPKLRIRGQTILNSLNWFKEQKIDPQKYRAEFIPHPETQLWATTFVVNNNGIFGEITRGGHFQLTQGFYDEGEPIAFAFNFKKWSLSISNKMAEKTIKEIVSLLKVSNKKLRQQLKRELGAEFSHDFLEGYFEATTSAEFGLWFIDYNQILGKIYQDFSLIKPKRPKQKRLQGLSACLGKVQGRAFVVTDQKLDQAILGDNDILVCPMTTPVHLPLIKKAAAVVTDFGGILSHAAIICRELGKPCITNTKVSTKSIHTGDLIEVDAGSGIISIIA